MIKPLKSFHADKQACWQKRGNTGKHAQYVDSEKVKVNE